MAEDEWSAMMNESDVEGHGLSAAALAALLSAAPSRWYRSAVVHLFISGSA